MRKHSVFFIAFALLSLITCPFPLACETLTFNTQDFRPFCYSEDGKVAGPFREIIDAVCLEAGFKVRYNLYPWRRAIKDAKKSNIQGLFVLGWNKPRTEWLYFSHPVVHTEYGFFFHKDDPIDFNKICDLEGGQYTIGVYGPSNTSDKLNRIAAEVKDLKIELNYDDIAGFKKLSANRVQAVYSNKDVGFSIIEEHKIKNIRYGGQERRLKYYIGFVKKNISKETVERFNHAYKKLYDKGIIKKILDTYNLEICEL